MTTKRGRRGGTPRRGETKRDKEEERKEEKEEETRDETTTRIGERRSRRCKMRKGETRRDDEEERRDKEEETGSPPLFFVFFFCNYITSPREMHTICVLLSCEYYIEVLNNIILQEEDVIR